MHRLLTFAVTLAAAALLAPAAAGQSGGADHRPRGGQAALDERLSLDEAVARAEKRHAARAVRAEEKRNGDRVEYRIRLLAEDGRVFAVTVDAVTGAER